MFTKTFVPFATKRANPAMLFPTRLAALTSRVRPMMFTNVGLMRQFSAAATTVNIEGDQALFAGPIPITVTAAKEWSPMDLLQAELDKVRETASPVCFYPRAHKVTHPHRWAGEKKNMHYSRYKLNCVLKCIRGKSLTDAKHILANLDKKGARYANELVDEIVERGIKRGRNPDMMFISTATCGGNYLLKKPDIKGRGRCGMIHKPVSRMRIVMEEKSSADFYKMVLKGDTPPGFSAVLRRIVFQNKGDFAHIRTMSHMLTSKGRYYRRVQFRRLVQSI